MPALKGSLSYTRFFVQGQLPSDFRTRYPKAIRLRAMKPLAADEDVTERSGWCVLGEPFETEALYDDVFWNEFVNLGFRTDRWVIPGPLLRSKLREAESAALSRKGRERLSRAERAEMKEIVMKKLRRQIPPATRHVDLSWSLDENLVRFFSHSERITGAMKELFEKTFGLELVAEAPYTLAAKLGLSRAKEAAWVALEETSLAAEVG